MLHKTAQFLKEHNYSNINTFFDNDIGGKKALEYLKEHSSNKNIIDRSSIYKGYNDFNEFYITVSQKELELKYLNQNLNPSQRERKIII